MIYSSGSKSMLKFSSPSHPRVVIGAKNDCLPLLVFWVAGSDFVITLPEQSFAKLEPDERMGFSMTFDQLQDIEGIESQKEAKRRVKRAKTALEP